MATLTLGRVGLATPTLPAYEQWRVSAREQRTVHRVSGYLQASSLAHAKALRRELAHQNGRLVALTYSDDDSFDGFYLQRAASVDARAQWTSLQGTGLFEWSADLEWIGDHSSTEFQSDVTGVVIANDHGVTAAEAVFWHSPPGGSADDDYFGGGGVSSTTRTGEDGDVPVFLDLTLTNGHVGPRYGAAPADFYNGAARIRTSEDGSTYYVRSGLATPNVPQYFVIGNSLIEVRAAQSGGTATGDIEVRCHNGTSWGSWIPFDIVWNSTTDIPSWNSFSIVRNDPEVCIVHLVRDADESPATDKRHDLYITLRRGAVVADFTYTYPTAVALTVDAATLTAATSITPSGASSAMTARQTSDDGDGNRWVVGSSDTNAIDTTNGGIDRASETQHDFFIGFEIGGSGADSNNDADALSLQYLGHCEEWVTPVPR